MPVMDHNGTKMWSISIRPLAGTKTGTGYLQVNYGSQHHGTVITGTVITLISNIILLTGFNTWYGNNTDIIANIIIDVIANSNSNHNIIWIIILLLL
jgi:hypothetical protein